MRKLLWVLFMLIIFSMTLFAGNTTVLDLSAKHYFYVDDNATNDLDVTGDFTIETWVKCNNSSFTGRICDRTNVLKLYAASSSIRFDLDDGGGNISTGTINSDQWYHVAVSRSGTTTRIFLDGVIKGSYDMALVASTEAFYIGGQATWFGAWDGRIDEFRFSDIARYTSDFTPPSEPLANDANTILLYHFDDDTQLPPDNSSSYTFTHTNVGIVQGDYVVDNELALPITLTSFTAEAKDGSVELAWETASETNNARFVIYRNGEAIGSVDGAGTTSEPHSYTYTDDAVIPGVTYTYVLADVDYANKETKYETNAVTVTVDNGLVEADFVVGAAFPNPFNPATIVPIELSGNATVKASLYDLTGREVKALINANYTAGTHELHIDGSGLTTGTYLLHVVIDNVTNIQKIALMK